MGEAPPAAAGAPEGEDATIGSVIDELTAALVPHGVATRYEPLNESLEALLSAGWKLDQAAGASGAFTLLLTRGSSHALCILVPKRSEEHTSELQSLMRISYAVF